MTGLAPGQTRAGVIYDETQSGDLSNDGSAPTVLALAPGLNDVIGTTGRGNNGIDRDYFTFTVPAGMELASIVVLPGTTTGGDVSFIGVQNGSAVTVSPTASSAAGLLGWKHFTAGNGNILPDMGIPAAGSTGFTGPLGSGDYAFWVQELSPGSFDYAFEFEVGPQSVPNSVPDSGPGVLGAVVLLGLVGRLGKSTPHRLPGASCARLSD